MSSSTNQVMRNADQANSRPWRNKRLTKVSNSVGEKTAAEKRAERFEADKIESQRKTTYGFVSRGEDNRLQTSEESRAAFFEDIQKRFNEHCARSNTSELADQFERLTVRDQKATNSKETIDWTFSSLRKLREALLYIKPNDFTRRVFLYSVRISAILGHYQTYVPSINYLLSNSSQLLSPHDISEIATLLILHLSHFNDENERALQIYYKYMKGQDNLMHLLKCWINKDYIGWKKLYDGESNSAVATVMKFGLRKMTQNAINSISASYYSMKLTDLNEMLPMPYDELMKKFDCKWEQTDPGVIVIRPRVGSGKVSTVKALSQKCA